MLRPGCVLTLAMGLWLATQTPAHAGVGMGQHHPRLFVISIGIDQYPAEGGLPPLRFAEADAKAVADSFGVDARFAFAKVVPLVLLGKDATLKGVTAAMQMVAQEAGADDVLVFYYAGMGSVTGQSGYLFGAADTVIKAGEPARNALRGEALATLLEQIPAGRQVVILDTCDARRAADSIRAALNPEDAFDLSTVKRQAAIFATDGVSVEAEELGHGLLTAALLAGMRGGAADSTGRVTEEGLQAYVARELPVLAAKYGAAGSSEPERLYVVSNVSGLGLTPTTAARTIGLSRQSVRPGARLMAMPRLLGPLRAEDEYVDASEDEAAQRRIAAAVSRSMAEEKKSSAADEMDSVLRSRGYVAAPGASSAAGTRALTPEPAASGAPDFGKDYALIVATDHYEDAGWKELHNAVGDAAALREELVRDYGFAPERITEIDDAKRADVIAAIKALIAAKSQFGPSDRLLVYFAGHGLRNMFEGYLAFADSKVPVDMDEPDTLLPFSTLRNALNAIPVPHILLILDVCYGGAFDGRTRFRSMLGNAEMGADRKTIIERAMEAKSRIYLTSGDENHTVSDGVPGEHSPFSRGLLETLARRGGEDHLLDIATLYSTLRSLPIQEPRAGYFDHDEAEQNADFLLIPTDAGAGTH